MTWDHLDNIDNLAIGEKVGISPAYHLGVKKCHLGRIVDINETEVHVQSRDGSPVIIFNRTNFTEIVDTNHRKLITPKDAMSHNKVVFDIIRAKEEQHEAK